MEIKFVNKDEFSNIFPKYQFLREHNNWKESMTSYIDKVYSNKKFNHDWIKYIRR